MSDESQSSNVPPNLPVKMDFRVKQYLDFLDEEFACIASVPKQYTPTFEELAAELSEHFMFNIDVTFDTFDTRTLRWLFDLSRCLGQLTNEKIIQTVDYQSLLKIYPQPRFCAGLRVVMCKIALFHSSFLWMLSSHYQDHVAVISLVKLLQSNAYVQLNGILSDFLRLKQLKILTNNAVMSLHSNRVYGKPLTEKDEMHQLDEFSKLHFDKPWKQIHRFTFPGEPREEEKPIEEEEEEEKKVESPLSEKRPASTVEDENESCDEPMFFSASPGISSPSTNATTPNSAMKRMRFAEEALIGPE